jgi:DnaJ family protein B protein 4
MPGGFNFGGMPSGGGTRTFHFSTGPGGGTHGFSFSNADDIFREFTKSAGGGAGRGGLDDDIFSMLGGMGGGGGGGSFRSRPGAGASFPSSKANRAPTPEPTIVEKDLPLTLDEIFKGTTKTVVAKSKSFDASGKRTVKDVPLEAVIKPGMRAGTKIKYRNIGDGEEGGRQDMHLIVKYVCETPKSFNSINERLLTTPTDRSPRFQSRARQPCYNRRPQPQGSSDRLGAHRPYHRRQIHPRFQAWPYTARP